MANSRALRFLVTGVTGQVGGELLVTLAPLGTVVAPPRAELDLASKDSVRNCIRAVCPDWIVNAGAYTAVDRAESEPELAFAVNADAVGVIGEEARKLEAKVLHYSTDYVFSGQGAEPYFESDATGPLGVYGASKLAGEEALLASGAAALVFRTSWVYGATGKNFLRTILKLARERDELRIVADQHGAPTCSRDLARMAAHVVQRVEERRGEERRGGMATGVYHAAGSGETTWAGFAMEAIRLVGEREPAVKLARIAEIATAQYPTPAARPANSRLNCEKLTATFGWRMPDWRVSLAQVVQQMEKVSGGVLAA